LQEAIALKERVSHVISRDNPFEKGTRGMGKNIAEETKVVYRGALYETDSHLFNI
jgi:hypothetical protein